MIDETIVCLPEFKHTLFNGISLKHRGGIYQKYKQILESLAFLKSKMIMKTIVTFFPTFCSFFFFLKMQLQITFGYHKAIL